MKNRLLIVASFVAILAACDYKPRNQGRVLYERNCASCHMENGQGLGELIPPVANADYVVEHQDELACIIRNGMSGEIIVNGLHYNGEMAGNSQLSEVEINNLVHYIIEVMNSKENAFNISDVKAQLEDCK